MSSCYNKIRKYLKHNNLEIIMSTKKKEPKPMLVITEKNGKFHEVDSGTLRATTVEHLNKYGYAHQDGEKYHIVHPSS